MEVRRELDKQQIGQRAISKNAYTRILVEIRKEKTGDKKTTEVNLE